MQNQKIKTNEIQKLLKTRIAHLEPKIEQILIHLLINKYCQKPNKKELSNVNTDDFNFPYHAN